MGFLKRIFGEEKKAAVESEKYIDLGEWIEEERKGKEEPATMHVKVAEIYRYEDLSNLTGPVYDGNILLLDFSPLVGDDFTLRRVTSELKQLTQDVGGDLAGVGKNMLVVTPTGIKIDREKLRGTTF